MCVCVCLFVSFTVTSGSTRMCTKHTFLSTKAIYLFPLFFVFPKILHDRCSIVYVLSFCAVCCVLQSVSILLQRFHRQNQTQTHTHTHTSIDQANRIISWTFSNQRLSQSTPTNLAQKQRKNKKHRTIYDEVLSINHHGTCGARCCHY